MVHLGSLVLLTIGGVQPRPAIRRHGPTIYLHHLKKSCTEVRYGKNLGCVFVVLKIKVHLQGPKTDAKLINTMRSRFHIIGKDCQESFFFELLRLPAANGLSPNQSIYHYLQVTVLITNTKWLKTVTFRRNDQRFKMQETLCL